MGLLIQRPRYVGTKVVQWIDIRLAGWGRKTILDPALWVTAVVSIGIASLGDEGGLRATASAVGAAQAQIGTALLGVVLAALAILTALLNDEYLLLLERVKPGLDADLVPFLHTAAVAALTTAAGVLLILIGNPENAVILRVVFGLAMGFFLYLLWIMLHLTIFVTYHLRARALHVKLRGTEKADAGEHDRQSSTTS